LLTESGVSVLAGTAFGKHGVHNLRISYANSQARIIEAMGRIRALVEPLVAAHA
jgi:aspartate/methionine/tyrosine aminotransferase